MGSRRNTTENGVQKERFSEIRYMSSVFLHHETAGSRERQLLLSYYKWLVNSMFDGDVETRQATSNPHEVIRMLWDFRSNDFLSLESFEEFLGSHQGKKMLRNSDDNSEDDEQMQPFVRRHRFNILVEEIAKSARPHFLPEWRTNVLKLVPEELKSKHPKLLQDTLTEITNIHGDLIKHIHLRSKLITKRRCQWMLEHVEKPFRKGFTDCYHIFKQNVEKLSNTLFMTHIAIKMVFEYCHQTLPNLIVNFKKYRSYRRLSQLVRLIHESIEICDNYLEKYWYTNLVLIMRDQDPLRSIDEEQWERFVKFANVIISENITELKRRSVQHILKYIGDPKKMPRLECFVRDGGQTITLRPPYEKYREAYMTILEKINEMFTGRTAIGSYLGFTSETSYLRTSLGKQYMKEAQDKVTEYSKITYSPVEEFFKELEKKYDVISVDHLQTELAYFLSNDHEFEDTWSFLERIRKVRRSLRDIPDFEYLNETSFRLNLAPFSKDLLNRVDSVKKQLVKDLVGQHLQGCEEICHQFENLTNVALAVPRTTSELCEFSSVLVSVNKEFVSTLEKIITVPIKGLYKVMQVTRVTKHHSNTYTKMIHWIQDLPAILYDSQQIIEECRLKFDKILIERTENFNKELDEFPSKLSILNYMNEAENIPTYLVHTRKLLKTMDYFHEEEKWINNEETLLKYPLSSFPEIDEIKAIVMPFSNLISKMDDWQLVHRNWLFTRCNEFNAEEVDTTVNEFHRLFKQLLRDYRITIQSMIMENNPRRFQGSLDDPNNLPAPIRLCTQTLDEIEKFKPFLPYIYMLSNRALKQRHWDELSKLLEYDMTPDLNKYFKYIMELDLHGHTSEIEIISDSACREEALVNSLLEMKEEWKDVKLPMDTLKGTTISIICSLEDIQSILDTHLRKTFFIRGSAFVKPIEDETESWYKLLQQVSKIIDIWANVQSQWLRFRPIFQAEGMMVEMPTEASHFQVCSTVSYELTRFFNRRLDCQPTLYKHYFVDYVDEGYKKLMKTAMGKQFVLKIARDEQIQYLPSFSERLEEIGEGIGKYFEKKRLMFPRFFFISDEELSKIITEKEKDSEIQPYLQKCFGGICALEFDDERNVLSAFSSMAEKMKFLKPISTSAASGKLEHWLIEIEKGMICSVKEHILQSFKDYEQKRWIYWLTAWSEQAVLCASQLHWTADIEKALSNGHITELQGIQKKIEHTLTIIIQLLRGDLVKTLRLTLGALTVLTEHANNVLNELIDKKVQSSHNFLWLAQLRYYLMDNEVVVRCTNTEICYAYEYLGNFSRLVITPLTERCYRILIGAHRMNMNGAVEGPTGTGKTEAVKDLARAVAAHCFVFNCSQGLDYHIMGKFFKGVAASGSWACFDEFNRIDVEVLSVIAQQMLCIFQAVQQGLENFVFENTELKLNRSCFIAVTMNPEYVGRNELPDNLKVYFRTVGMVVPDYTCIAKLLLLSYGFKESRDLAIKIVTVYKLCSDQLSSQCHYNFGMRELKAVLDASRDLKVRNPETNEVAIVLRSIHDVTRPKCLPGDITLFEWILSDVFHKETPRLEREGLKTIMKQACLQLDLEPEEEFIFKVSQIYELMIVRHGLMLIGEPFSGKTSALKVLSNSIMNMVEEDKLEVRLTFINPKALSLEQLYGELDPISLEWKDGVIPYTLREFLKLDTIERKWLIFDGPVDTKWIENLNTVLDDNRKLCLLSGDTILLSPEITFFFETTDLFQASPATVSRCGMIFMDLSNVGLKAIVTSWLKHLNKKSSTSLTSHGVLITMLVDWLFPTTLSFLKIHGVQLISIGEICLIHSTLKIVEMLLYDAIEKNTKHDSMRYWIKAAFVFATAWGIGGILDCKSRILFDEFCRNMWDDNNPESGIPGIVSSIDVSIPQTGLLYNYIYTFKGKGSWDYWPELVLEVKPTESVSIFQSLIPTVESERCQYLMQLHIKHNIPMLLIGPSGTGKSFYFQNTLTKKLYQDKFASFSLIFTSRTTAAEMQELIISRLKKHKSGTYAPYEGKKCVVFIDNLSMPVRDEYGSQPALEHLRQYFDHHYWFDIKDNTKVYLDRMQFVAAAGITATNDQGVSSRLLRHFSVYSMNKFPEESMSTIFSTLLRTAYKRGDFPSEIFSSDIINCIVQATNKLYTAVNDYLLPVPGKEHYLFNLRDYSNVIQGCSFLKKESAEDPKMPIRLWVHEILREFYDRLVDKDDRAWLYEELRTVVKSTFSQDFDQVLDTYADGSGKVTEDSLADLMFGNFLRTNVLEKKYESHPNIEAFYERAFTTLTEYNKDRQFRSKLNIVLFRYVLDHLNRICRVISFPGGSVLLIGVYGSGRRSLVKLASCLTSTNLFEPDINVSYDVSNWKQDVKSVLKESGGHGKDTIFFFSEKKIKDEVFLEDIDFLLNCGEVPNIFQPSDVQEILDLTRLDAQGGRKILDISTAAVYAYFINRCKEKLHIVLSFNCVGPSLRKYTRLYPSFINCCTIDWFQPFEPMEANEKVFKLEVWPEEAFCKVAGRYLEDIKLTSEIKKAIVEAFKYVHVTASALSGEFLAKTGRHTHVTPVIFIEFLKLFIKLYREVQAELNEGVARYQGGLGKLEFAGREITELQNKLLELKPQIESAARDSSEVMKLIEKETMEVAKASELVKADEVVANKQFAASQQLKKECEAELAQAIPILEDAIAALNTLKPADITLVKSMKNPPYAVKLVMAAVCVLKAVKPAKSTDPATGRKKLDYWKPSKKILSDMYFLQTLRDFDKDNISAEIMQKIRTEYLPNKDFNPATVAKASSAAEGLCKWVLAMDLYDRVAKEVAPKKAKLEIANQQYNATLELLKTKQDEVDRLEAKLGKLRAELHMTHTKKGQLEDTVVEYTNRITRANKLIDGLGGEKDHWSSEAKRLAEELQLLPGDIFMSCGIMIYLAPYSATFRLACIGDWHKYVLSLGIPCSNEYSLRKVLGCELDIQKWIASELPRDDFSVDNAIIMDKSKRWPLMVDPQSQANKWIRNIEPDLIVLKLSDSDFMESLQGFASNGYPVLIENIGEEFNKELELFLIMIECPDGPLCHPSPVGKVGRTGPNSEGFRLYMTSRLRNPNFKPEIFNIVTVVDFTVTLEGLEEHLLSLFVAKERPDLESKYDRYIIRSALNRDSIQRSEDDILVILSKTPGNILQKEEAINQVDKAKELSKFVQEDQRRIERILEEIDEIRSRYRFTALYSAVLFYCVLDLANVNIMYQFSLEWFINLYTSNINLSQTTDECEKRLKIFRNNFTLRIYRNTTRSLYDKDKVLFTFSLCTSTMLLYEKITDEELRFFLNPEIGTDKSIDNPAENWLSKKTWDQLIQLAEMKGYEGFLPSFVEDIESWEKFWYNPCTNSSEIPDPWVKKLSEFQKLLLIRVLRPDKVSSAVHDLVVTVMGKGFVSPPAFDLAEAFDESNYLRPIIVLLSPGSEPILAITNFANEVSFSDGFQIISLGQAQGPIAEEALIKAGKEGKWVCLENCHLAPSWIPNLEKIFDRITNEPDVSHGFRLWLTTYPSSKFPPTLLDKGLKLTNERSAGLRQRLYRPFISDPVKDPRFHDSCPFKAAEFYRLMYAVSFFNAVVQERLNFGPIGWNVPYEFGESDLQISLKQLQVYLTEEGRLFSYDALRYHIGECNYGGRVMDPWDLRVLTTILSEYVNRRVVQDSNYHLHPGDEYGLPMSMTYSECLQLIEKLPDEPPTEVYGLHSNAGLKRDLHQSNDFLYSALMIRGEILRIENVISLQTVLETAEDILHKMPKRLDVEEAITKYPLRKEYPMNTVLIKEMERYNMLMDVLCSTLEHLKDAIQGIVLMTEDLQKMAESIFAGEVPEVWKTYSYPSIKPLGSYVDDFEHRVDSIEEWYNIGVLPSYWLPGIFSPHAFLVGVLQSYARTNTIPIDTLTFDCPVLGKEDGEPPTRGVHVYGLFMEGAAWNSEEGVLVEQPVRIRQSSMPIIWIKPIRQSIYDKRNRYDCPLYVTSERRGALCTRGISSNFVMTVPLKINGKVSHWIKRGVAMICQSDE